MTVHRKVVYEDSEVQAEVIGGVVRIKLVGMPAIYLSVRELANVANAVAQHPAAETPCPDMGEWDPLGQGGGG